ALLAFVAAANGFGIGRHEDRSSGPVYKNDPNGDTDPNDSYRLRYRIYEPPLPWGTGGLRIRTPGQSKGNGVTRPDPAPIPARPSPSPTKPKFLTTTRPLIVQPWPDLSASASYIRYSYAAPQTHWGSTQGEAMLDLRKANLPLSPFLTFSPDIVAVSLAALQGGQAEKPKLTVQGTTSISSS